MTLLRALAPLLREAELLYMEWARRELQHRNPMHDDLPGIVRRINELRAQRPRTEHKPRSRCEMSALCAHDAACPDVCCPGRPQMHTQDGGHTFSSGVVFPIENTY